MLDSISWPEFVTVVALVAGGYYVITFMLFYNGEITNLFKQQRSNHSNEEVKSNHLDSSESDDLIGAVRYENREEKGGLRELVASTEELQFAPSDGNEEAVHAVDLIEEQHQKDLERVLEEINSLLEVASLGSKDESIPLLRALLSNYSHLRGTKYQQKVSLHILHACSTACQFRFELSEINSLWTEGEPSSKDNQ